MQIGAFCRAAGLACLLCLPGMVSEARAQTCPAETGFRTGLELEEGWNRSPPEIWCKRTGDYWNNMIKEVVADTSKKQLCENGSLQSPIALSTPPSDDAGLGPIQFNYFGKPGEPFPTTDRELRNTGHTVELSLDQAPTRSIVFGGRTYQLKQVHFHYPSEHVLDGERFALELHFVHDLVPDRLNPNESGRAVVAVFYRRTYQEQSHLVRAFGRMTNAEGAKTDAAGAKTTIPVSSDTIVSLLPATKSYLTYQGSLTTPTGANGCDENVTWLILTHPQYATHNQIHRFRTAISYDQRRVKVNARPYITSAGTVRTSTDRGVRRWSDPNCQGPHNAAAWWCRKVDYVR